MLAYYALQLRDTRVLLRNVHYPFEGPSEQELEGVDIARCFIDPGDCNSQPKRRIGDHVLMPDVRTWRKNPGSSTFVSCIDGAFLSDCFCGLGACVGCATPTREAVRSCSASHFLLLQKGSWQTFTWSVKLGSELDGSPS